MLCLTHKIPDRLTFSGIAGSNPANAWLLKLDSAGQIAGCAIMRPASLTSIDTGAIAEDVQGVATGSSLAPISSTLTLNGASTIKDEQCYAPRSP